MWVDHSIRQPGCFLRGRASGARTLGTTEASEKVVRRPGARARAAEIVNVKDVSYACHSQLEVGAGPKRRRGFVV
jgi:hypothetical protein